jgi:hypothetical protein
MTTVRRAWSAQRPKITRTIIFAKLAVADTPQGVRFPRDGVLAALGKREGAAELIHTQGSSAASPTLRRPLSALIHAAADVVPAPATAALSLPTTICTARRAWGGEQ